MNKGCAGDALPGFVFKAKGGGVILRELKLNAIYSCSGVQWIPPIKKWKD